MPTPDPTGAWLSLDARFLKRQKRTIGWIYAAALRSALATRLGLTWGPVTEGHGDIVGVPASLITEFSQRSEQVEAALAERLGAWVDAHDGDRALVLMAAFTGLRRGELFGLTRRRLDLLHRAVTVTEQRQQLRNGTLIVGPPKTDAGRRTVALPGPLIPEIEAHLATYGPPDADGLVFTGPKGGPLRDHVWQTKWARARAALGLADLHSHDLRHVANTLTAALGSEHLRADVRMDHVPSEAALRYQHATRDREVAIAAALGELIARPAATVTPLRPTSDGRT